MGVQERLKQFLQSKNLTYKQFELVCGLGNGTAARIGENTRDTILLRISKAFPDFNTHWLMSGEGDMLRPAIEQKIGDVKDSELHEVNVIKGDPNAYNTLLRIVETNQKTIEKFQEQIDRLLNLIEVSMRP